jgi:hypothetical protein
MFRPIHDGLQDYEAKPGIWNCPAFSIRIRPVGLSHEGIHVGVTLGVKYLASYPKTAPMLELSDRKGIGEKDCAELLEMLKRRASELLGEVMVYELIVSAGTCGPNRPCRNRMMRAHERTLNLCRGLPGPEDPSRRLGVRRDAEAGDGGAAQAGRGGSGRSGGRRQPRGAAQGRGRQAPVRHSHSHRKPRCLQGPTTGRLVWWHGREAFEQTVAQEMQRRRDRANSRREREEGKAAGLGQEGGGGEDVGSGDEGSSDSSLDYEGAGRLGDGSRSRYLSDFKELGLLGRGGSGQVVKVGPRCAGLEVGLGTFHDDLRMSF